MAAIAWPSALLGLASIIDNPWHVCTKRAENAGKQLAEVLVSRLQVMKYYRLYTAGNEILQTIYCR